MANAQPKKSVRRFDGTWARTAPRGNWGFYLNNGEGELIFPTNTYEVSVDSDGLVYVDDELVGTLEITSVGNLQFDFDGDTYIFYPVD